MSPGTAHVQTKGREMTFGGRAGRTPLELGSVWTWTGETRKEVVVEGFSEIKRLGIQIRKDHVVRLKVINQCYLKKREGT